MSDNALIKVRNVSFSYQSKQIYKNLTLDIPKGKITAILGPSGTGKTTILRLIGAQLTPNEGTIEFDGTNIHGQNQRPCGYHPAWLPAFLPRTGR